MTAKTAFKLAATAQPSVIAAQPTAQIALSTALADVALIDAETCAAVGGMSVSWWNAEVAAGRAPAPKVQRPRCTRYLLIQVREFWRRFAEEGAADTEAGGAMKTKLVKASAKARELRSVVQGQA